MKNFLTVSLLTLSVLAPSMSSAQSVDVDISGNTPCAVISVNLRYGSTDITTGGAVSVLQDFLYTHGYLTSQPTGFFGSMTKSAVASFQNANNIPATPPGLVGPITRAKIRAIDCNGSSPAISPSSNPAIAPILSSPLNQIQKKAVITSIDSAGNPVGTISTNEKASIHGTGLSGKLTIRLGNQESQTVTVTGISDSYAEFTVPSRQQAATVSVTVTNSSGITSNFYQVNIAVPKAAAIISSIESLGNPTGTVSAGHKAFIHGIGLKGKLTIKIGNQEPQIVTIDNDSETSAEFTVPTRAQSSIVSISVTNDSNKISNYYLAKIDVSN